MNRAFSAGLSACIVPGAISPGSYESRAVGALNRYEAEFSSLSGEESFFCGLRPSIKREFDFKPRQAA
jgi:hypothetical protein